VEYTICSGDPTFNSGLQRHPKTELAFLKALREMMDIRELLNFLTPTGSIDEQPWELKLRLPIRQMAVAEANHPLSSRFVEIVEEIASIMTASRSSNFVEREPVALMITNPISSAPRRRKSSSSDFVVRESISDEESVLSRIVETTKEVAEAVVFAPLRAFNWLVGLVEVKERILVTM